jgi:hypothetical protein
MQNKPNFPCFSPENNDATQKQTQFKANSNPIQTQFWPNNQCSLENKANSNPNQNLSSIAAHLLPCRGANFKAISSRAGFPLDLWQENIKVDKKLTVCFKYKKCPYQYKKTVFSCYYSQLTGLLSKREELLSCQLTVVLLLKAQ